MIFPYKFYNHLILDLGGEIRLTHPRRASWIMALIPCTNVSGNTGGGDRPNQPLYLYPQTITNATKSHCITIEGSKREVKNESSPTQIIECEYYVLVLRKQCRNSYPVPVVVPCFDESTLLQKGLIGFAILMATVNS